MGSPWSVGVGSGAGFRLIEAVAAVGLDKAEQAWATGLTRHFESIVA
jgi:hypothetical protein